MYNMIKGTRETAIKEIMMIMVIIVMSVLIIKKKTLLKPNSYKRYFDIIKPNRYFIVQRSTDKLT